MYIAVLWRPLPAKLLSRFSYLSLSFVFVFVFCIIKMKIVRAYIAINFPNFSDQKQ